MRMRKLLSPDNSTNTTAAVVGVNNTCNTTTTTTTTPGGHGGNITLFRNRHYNPGNGNIYLLNEYFTLMLMYFGAWPPTRYFSPKQHENASSC